MGYKQPTEEQQKLLAMADELEAGFRALARKANDMNRARRNALAVTRVEEGFMWLRKSIMKDDQES